MARTRKIQRMPNNKNCYLVDAKFLANRFIPAAKVTDLNGIRVEWSQAWWREIDHQLRLGHALVYVPDLWIAEAFNVLAKKYYVDGYFARPVDYKNARDKLREFLHVSLRTLKPARRSIKVHDISLSRDIIIAAGRFDELFFKHKLSARVVDVVILLTAKYLIDFPYISANNLHVGLPSRFARRRPVMPVVSLPIMMVRDGYQDECQCSI
ncbi:MAG TPA: hypothetical protein VNN77_20040 [candidate division Zixibacteria bacterium]|nr:hypothetical protein [candidate division Zixibacteria bacterium]